MLAPLDQESPGSSPGGATRKAQHYIRGVGPFVLRPPRRSFAAVSILFDPRRHHPRHWIEGHTRDVHQPMGHAPVVVELGMTECRKVVQIVAVVDRESQFPAGARCAHIELAKVGEVLLACAVERTADTVHECAVVRRVGDHPQCLVGPEKRQHFRGGSVTPRVSRRKSSGARSVVNAAWRRFRSSVVRVILMAAPRDARE
jgi:hypothetical protein